MSIADFMFTPREQRVLSLVLSAPERTFNLAELMSRSGAGSGAGQHTVRRLWEAGVLRGSRAHMTEAVSRRRSHAAVTAT